MKGADRGAIIFSCELIKLMDLYNNSPKLR